MIPLTINAIDLDDAVNIANELKTEGKYNLFRGQRDADWKVHSSISRFGKSDIEIHLKRIDKFAHWIKSSRQILPYIDDDDQIVAIAQHHGLATWFIDFTTEPEVAGYFAKAKGTDATHGAIYLVNEEDFNSIAGMLGKDGHPLARFLRIEVQHLWRLEAQKGLFLESRMPLERVYPLDRIVFPHNDFEKTIDDSDIYPSLKSHLERQIDEFLLSEKMERGLSELLKTPGIITLNLDEPEFTLTGEIALLREWDADSRWGTVQKDRWEARLDERSLAVPTIDLRNLALNLPSIIESRRNFGQLALFGPKTEGADFQQQTELLWNGMRLLPYSSEQISSALLSLFKIHSSLRGVNLILWDNVIEATCHLISDPIEVEFGLVNGRSTRAVVPTDRLLNCVKKEITLDPKQTKNKARLERLLINNYSVPRKIFEFNSMVTLFSGYVIPWQIALERPFIAFSPLYINALGLP